jgi:hypothetical protein
MGLKFYGNGTIGAKLPHPPISLSIFLVIEEALCTAWNYLKDNSRPGFNLLSATEDVITQELFEELFDHIFNKGIVDGFDRELFTVITREPKVRNYNGANLDKMPDILIGLVDRLNVFKLSQDGCFIECKPVDSNHTTGVHYCNKGIIRFVQGDYAWAMTCALMVGYICNGYTIVPKLDNALRRYYREVPTSVFPQQCRLSKPGKNNEVVYFSKHSRTFSYCESGQQAPDIMIRHLWLRRD